MEGGSSAKAPAQPLGAGHRPRPCGRGSEGGGSAGGRGAAPRPWSPSADAAFSGSRRAYLNLSFDGLVDAGWSTTHDVTALETGDHDPLQRGFTHPERGDLLDGAVDPYFKGVANIVFKLDEDNETTVELEEMYLLTTLAALEPAGEGRPVS